MKKILALLMAMAMLLALAACGSSSSSSGSSSTTDGSASASTEADGDTTEDGDSSADSTGDSTASYDTVELTFILSNNETETGGMLTKYFTEYITEASGGAVTFKIYYGGTYCDSGEQLDNVGSGAIDMCMTGTSDYTAQLPLTNFPSFVYGSQQDALDYANYIAFENEETASLIEAEMAANGVVALGLNAGGTNAYFFKSEYASLSDAASAGLLLGCGSNLSCYEALGFNTTSTMPWDCYTALSTGAIDCTQMAFAAGVSMSWQEVAPYLICNNQYAFGNWWLMNSDVWAGLSADTQALFYEAAAATSDYSVELYAADEATAVETVESSGGSVIYMNDEDTATERDIFFEQSYADCRAAAESAGVSDEMEIILAATNEYLGLDID